MIRRLIRLAAFCFSAALAGCGLDQPVTGQETPFSYDRAAVQRSDTLLFLVPGALSSVDMFDQLEAGPGASAVYYRFPGYDGLPFDHRLSLAQAAEDIADFVVRYPNKRVWIVGYSTGGTIAVLASSKLRSRDVKAVGLSPAVPLAGGIPTALRVSNDIAVAVVAAGSTNREAVWLEYYRTLLFGRKGRRDPSLQDRIEAHVAIKKATLDIPEPAVARAHSANLRRWTLPPGLAVDPARVRFFVGFDDPVFSTAQTMRFAKALGGIRVVGYPGQGHLMFVTRPGVFDDILAFLRAR